MQHSLTTPNISAKIAEKGIRPSVQRIAVLRYLLEHRTHPTVDEIYQALSAEIPSLSRTTIYNTLRAFVEADLARLIAPSSPDAISRFDSTNFGDHAHFVCRQCGRVIDVSQFDSLMPESEEFVVDQTDIYYRGLCCECAKQTD